MEVLLLALIAAVVSAEAVLMLVMAAQALRKPQAAAAETAEHVQLPPLSEQLLQEWLYGAEEDKNE